MAYVNVLEWKAEQVSEWLQGKLQSVTLHSRSIDLAAIILDHV